MKIEEIHCYINYDEEISRFCMYEAERDNKINSHKKSYFHTQETMNKAVGIFGQEMFRIFIKKEYDIDIPRPELNVNGMKDFYDFKINNKTIDIKTLSINDYWGEEDKPNWSENIKPIKNLKDLLNNFYGLVLQTQLGIKDKFNDKFTKNMNKSIKIKDVYWFCFVKRKYPASLYEAEVFFIGWCLFEDLLEYDKNNKHFRFSKNLGTNIAIPLKELNDNNSFFKTKSL